MNITNNTVVFLEFFTDKKNVLSGGKRSPQYQWQNFFEAPVELFVDPLSSGVYNFLPFNADGFQYVYGGRQNQLTIELPGLTEIFNITEDAMLQASLIYAFLYKFDGASDTWSLSNPALASGFIGEIENAASNFFGITWIASTGIDMQKAQMPYHKISSSIIAKQFGQ